MKKKYDVDYFINKFSAIPEDKWTTGQYVDFKDDTRRCAIGHCSILNDKGVLDVSTDEATAWRRLAIELHCAPEPHYIAVNDGTGEFKELGDTPKERVLNYLTLLKAGMPLD